ncbi:GNAT family N-acetyltransferase [Bacteroidota bacterium]
MSIYLRKLQIEDSEQLIKLANNKSIADDMCTLPSPFKKEDADLLINRSLGEEELIMGIINSSNKLAGVVMLRDFEPCHEQAELSVWIGEPFWGKGFGTQAIAKMSNFGFEEKGLNRIYAYCMVRNIASQRILEKSGFLREGLLRERVIKNRIYEDVYMYAILKNDIRR